MDVTHPGQQTLVVAIEDASQVGQARREASQAAVVAGFDETDAARVALVTTELATNVFRHAGRGEIHINVVPGNGARGVEVIGVDRGPGFDMAQCMPDGYSTAGSRGEGLGAIQRQADVLDLHADHRGAVVLARMYPRGFARADIRFGASQQRLHDETVCGDGWAMALRDDRISVLLVDGLGHGFAANDAAQACVAAWCADPYAESIGLMASLNDAMTGTRGGAVALASFDRPGGALRYVGIGNISGSLQTAEQSRGLASHPGIVGAKARAAQAFDFPDSTGKLLVMFSDGLQSRWNLRDYPGLLFRHPSVITSVLHRDFCRGRDDVTVFAIRLEASHDRR
ncbi:ATP-binding protein [Bacillus sp. NP157]|nr:ATP-binding protein [Bacillus sp. NP157]